MTAIRSALRAVTQHDSGYALGQVVHGIIPRGTTMFRIDDYANINLSYNPMLPAWPFGNFAQAFGDIIIPTFGRILTSVGYNGNGMNDPFDWAASICGPEGGYPWGYGARGKIIGTFQSMCGISAAGADLVQNSASGYVVPLNGTPFTRNASKMTPAATLYQTSSQERFRVLTANSADWANGCLVKFFTTPIGTGRGARNRMQILGNGNFQIGSSGNADTGSLMQVRGEGGTNEQQKLGFSGGTVATATLTSNGSLPVDGNTVTIGDTASTGVVISTTYTFKNTPAQLYDVKIGASATECLQNLAYAIHNDDLSGLSYYFDENGRSPAMRDVRPPATSPTGLTLTLTAAAAGTWQNSYVSTTNITGWSFGAATFTGGTQVSSGAFKLLFYGTFPTGTKVGGAGVAINAGTIVKWTHGSTALVGTGTLWSSGTAAQKLNVGEYIRTTNGSEMYRVDAVNSDTSVTIASSVPGKTGWVGDRTVGLITTDGTDTVTGVGTSFTTELSIGDKVTFGSDATQYTVLTIPSNLSVQMSTTVTANATPRSYTRVERNTGLVRCAEITASLNWNFTNDDFQTALEGCPSVGTGTTSGSGGIPAVTALDNTGSGGTLGLVTFASTIRGVIYVGDFIRVTGDTSGTIYKVGSIDSGTNTLRLAIGGVSTDGKFTAGSLTNFGINGTIQLLNVAVENAANLSSGYKVFTFCGALRAKNILLCDVVSSTLTGGGYAIAASTIGVPSGDQVLLQLRQGGQQGSTSSANLQNWETILGTGFTVSSAIDSFGAYNGVVTSLQQRSQSVSGTATLVTKSASLVLADTTSGYTLTLPSAPTNGEHFTIVRTTGTGVLVIGRNGKTIDGAASNLTLDASEIVRELTYDNTGWRTTDQYPVLGSTLSLTDVTTNNVTSTVHGFAPKSPADATQFLNGAATPAFAAVKDSDLSTTDITTNNVSSSKHGFAPKSPSSATQFLNGAATPAFATVKDSDLAFTDVTTNNVTSSAHGYAPKSPSDSTKFLNGAATPAFAVPPGTELAYAQRTTAINVAGTSGAQTDLSIDTGSVSYDGTAVYAEFFSPRIDRGTSSIVIVLWDGSTEIGRMCSQNVGQIGMTARVKFTPTAASHQYKLFAYVDAGTGAVQAGAGTAGNFNPAYLRIVKA